MELTADTSRADGPDLAIYCRNESRLAAGEELCRQNLFVRAYFSENSPNMPWRVDCRDDTLSSPAPFSAVLFIALHSPYAHEKSDSKQGEYLVGDASHIASADADRPHGLDKIA